MATSPREKAERCFALARSTTFEGERTAAISRGEAICAASGLDIDDFDVPGRPKSERPARATSAASTVKGPRRPSWGDLARAHYSPRRESEGQYTMDELRDLMRGHHRHMSGREGR